MSRLRPHSFRADPKIMEELDNIARQRRTSRGALIRAAILNIITQHYQTGKPRKMRVLEI